MDLFKNFAKVTVSTGYDASATSVVLSGGHGTKLPAAPFNATWWNSTDYADPTDDPNVEIVRVTAIVTDTLTVTRGQEGISASTKNTASKTYKMVAGLTAKTFNTDLAGAAMPPQQTINGRLTLETGVPVSTTNQNAKTTIYFTPFDGNCISLYDDPMWVCHQFSELSLPLGTLVADKNYDVFVYDNAGTITLELSAAWASNTARTDALALQDGIYVKSGAATRRYVGTFRTVTTTTTEDSLLKRFVWNRSNIVARELYFHDAASHTYDGPVRMWANNAEARIQFVSGLPEETYAVGIYGELSGLAGTFTVAGAALDSTVDPYRSLAMYMQSSASNLAARTSAAAVVSPQIGYHSLNLLERTFSGTGTFNLGTISAIIRG